MSIKIVSDSACDLPGNIIQKLGIKVIPLYINPSDKGYLDGVEITRQEFYKNLPNYSIHPTTGLPGTQTFTQVYQKLISNGADGIISIHISKSLSSTLEVARSAANEINIMVLDSDQNT